MKCAYPRCLDLPMAHTAYCPHHLEVDPQIAAERRLVGALLLIIAGAILLAGIVKALA